MQRNGEDIFQAFFKKLPQNIQRSALKKLWMLNRSVCIDDLIVPPVDVPIVKIRLAEWMYKRFQFVRFKILKNINISQLMSWKKDMSSRVAVKKCR
jgi:hypothetical protein